MRTVLKKDSSETPDVEKRSMRITCERDELHRALQSVSGVVAAKGIHPVYESVSMIASESGIEFQATDLEIGMRYTLAAAENVRIEASGNAVVPAQRLAMIVRELPGGPVTLTWNADTRECTVTAGRSRFRLQGQSPEDFPEIPRVEGTAFVVIERDALARMIKLTAFAAARERMRFALNGVLMRVEGDTAEFVATDGRRLARATTSVRNEGNAEFQAIVPTKGLQHLEKSVAAGDTEIRIAVGNNHLSASTARVNVVSRLVEGSFPNYRDVIPQSCRHKALLPREETIAALRRAALVTSRDAQSVRMRFADGQLAISSQSSEGAAEEYVTCDVPDATDALGFNPDFLLDALAVLTGEQVAFEWNDKKQPGKMTEGTYTYVVMPVSLD